MRMRRDYLISNADIILGLLRSGYAHACDRCERPIHVKHASGLCVWCYNEQRSTEREPALTRMVRRRPRRSEPPAASLEPAPAT